MELWFIYAVLSVFLSGFFAFIQKYGTQNNLNSYEFTRWLLVGQLMCAIMLWGFSGFSLDSYKIVFSFGVLTGFIYTLVHLLRALALENIDTTIYFPINKFLGPTLVAIGGVLFLRESLSAYEYIGVGLGVLVPLLLLDKVESSRQKNLAKGLELLIVGTLVSAVAIFISRIVAVGDASLWLFIFIQGIVGVVFLYFSQRRFKAQAAYVNMQKIHKAIAFFGGVINTLSIYCILASFETGLISVTYTINSFYILIPIVLSVWLYKEHMNTRKALAIGLSIVAVIFFQL